MISFRKKILCFILTIPFTVFLNASCDEGGGSNDNYIFDELTGDVNFYFGNFHSHTKYSDGDDYTPDDAFTWARDIAGFDFYAVTDHAESISSDEWSDTGTRAELFNDDSSFVSLRGFEWSHPLSGHICVFLSDDFTSVLKDLTLDAVYSWINNNNTIGQFNHPGRESYAFDNLKYETALSGNMFAIETGNKGSGNTVGEFYDYYIMALDNGWKVAPTANQDNHSLSANTHRSVYIGNSLSKQELTDAMKARRIYSTDDPNMKIVFKYYNMWMGSTIQMNSVGTVKFDVAIRDDEPILMIELITNNGDVVFSHTCSENDGGVSWEPVVTVSQDSYFFLRVTEKNQYDDGDGDIQIAVTAPIWFDVP